MTMTPQYDLQAAASIPVPARILGLIGVFPCAAAALAVCLSPQIRSEAGAGLIVYGAVILSFLGGVRWGFAVLEGNKAGWTSYGISVIPPVVAWFGTLIGGPVGLLVLASALALWLVVERTAPLALPLPAWYLRLRAMLTAIATLSLLVAAVSW